MKPVAHPLRDRAATLRLIARYMHGRAPRGLQVRASSWRGRRGESGLRTEIRVDAPGRSALRIPVHLYLPPQAAPDRPAPCVLFLCNRNRTEMTRGFLPDARFWPVRFILSLGWATAAVHLRDIAHDTRADLALAHGLLGFDASNPRSSRGGAVSAWAWVASRVADLLARHPALDAGRLAVAGHSRGGKAALLAAARDTRFAAAFVNQSGCGGAARLATKRGEHIADLVRTFPHWFCPAWADYAGRDAEVPVDAPDLIACVAPRALFVSSAKGDDWADPAAEGESCELARSAWTRATAHRLVHHRRAGSHGLEPADWRAFLAFADRVLG